MKVLVATVPDFDYEVVDVVIRLENEDTVTNCWEQSEIFASELATILNCEYIGTIEE